MLPSQYKPTKPDDFIGPAREYAKIIERLVAEAKPHGTPIKVLFNGRPGTGKSSLAEYASMILGCSKWTTTKLNGTQVKIEVLEEISKSLHFTDLFGDYRLLWIEEADKIPHVAQVRFLTLMDDLPLKTAVVCTSNCKIEEFENRFQTRFMVCEVEGPKEAELETFLARFLKDTQRIRQIATFACGNVRQALLDCQMAMLT